MGITGEFLRRFDKQYGELAPKQDKALEELGISVELEKLYIPLMFLKVLTYKFINLLKLE